MKKQYDLAELVRTFGIVSPEEISESLDNVLFSATVSYLDPSQGAPTEKMVEDVTNVRFLLEALREFVSK